MTEAAEATRQLQLAEARIQTLEAAVAAAEIPPIAPAQEPGDIPKPHGSFKLQDVLGVEKDEYDAMKARQFNLLRIELDAYMI